MTARSQNGKNRLLCPNEVTHVIGVRLHAVIVLAKQGLLGIEAGTAGAVS